MRTVALVLLAAGCTKSVKETVAYSEPILDCPTDRPLIESDLDCMCGSDMTVTIIDTVVSTACDELWCHAEERTIECITYGTTPGDTGTGSTSTSTGGSGP